MLGVTLSFVFENLVTRERPARVLCSVLAKKLFLLVSAKICQVISRPMLTKCRFSMVQNVRKDKDTGCAAFSTVVIKQR